MFKKILAAVLCVATMCAVGGCAAENEEPKESGVTYVENNPSKQIQGNVGEVKLEKGDKYAVISVKDFGDITIKLFPDVAPKGVEVFEKLVGEGFFNGKVFHRVMADFMAQAGAAEEDSEYEQFTIETNYNMRHFYGAFCYANALGKNSTQFYIVNNKKSQDVTQYSVSVMDNNIKACEGIVKQLEGDKTSNEYKYYYNQLKTYQNMKAFIQNYNDEIIAKYKEVGGTPSLDGNYTVFGHTVDGFDVIDKIAAVELEVNDKMGGSEISKPVEDIIIDKIEIKVY